MGAAPVRRLALFFGALTFATLGTSTAFAQTEIIPTGDLLEDPVKKVKKLVNDVVEKTDDAVEETKETVEHVAKETAQTVNETVDHVEKEVKGVLEGTIEQPGGSVPKTPDGPVVSDAPKEGPRSPEARPIDTAVRSGRVDIASSARSSSPPDSLITRTATMVDGALPANASPAAPATPGDLAQSLAFPLLMTFIVVAYLLFQGRFDRRDPKLLFQVDLDGERLSFE